MSGQNLMVNAVQPDEKWMYRVGGITALAIGVAYLAIIALYAAAGVPPEGGAARLDYLIGKTGIWWAIVGISVLTNFLYAAATSESQRALFVAAATFASAVLESPLAAVWAIGTLSFGFLIIGFVMLNGVFNRLTAYMGILTGTLGILAVAGIGVAVILNAIFAMLWLFLIGGKLYRLSQ